MIRLAVVISHPIQYFAPLFARLAATPGIELKVFYCCDWGVCEYHDPRFGTSFVWDIPLLDGYEHEFLSIKKRPENLGFRAADNPTVGERLVHFAPDAVWLHGYSQRTQWRVWLWALVRPAPVVVLDEPTSEMDPWAEFAWSGKLRGLAAGRTLLVVTHRPSIARYADLIHVMEAGQVVESGSHEELVAKAGRYAALW